MSEAAPRPSWREPLGLFVAAVLCLGLITTLAFLIPPLRGYAAALAAVVFLGLPYVILRRRREDPADFGIGLDALPRQDLLWGVASSLVVFALFIPLYHLWETRVLEREAQVSLDHYWQWPDDLQQETLTLDAPGAVTLRYAGRALHVQIRDVGEPTRLLIQADRPFRWSQGSTLRTIPAPEAWFEDPTSIDLDTLPPGMNTESDRWLLELPAGTPAGRATLRGPPGASPHHHPRALTLRVLDASPPHAGEPRTVNRGLGWLLLWALTHLLIVALPEEYFYRGYLQTRFHGLLNPGDGPPRRFLGFSRANWLTSALFALGHVLVPIAGTLDPARAAVFFPSLLFGWLREKTGTIIAPTILHGASNMMIILLQVHYF